MAKATTARRADLRDRLIDLAEARIAAEGLGALRARDLAKEAGCSVGAIYNAAGDLREITLAVNARTFRRLGAAVEAVLDDGASPVDRLIAMSLEYLDFAKAEYGLWRALFDFDRPAGEAAPEWYLTDMEGLLSIIAAPLAEIAPELDARGLSLLTRALFSSVHGMVLLGIEDASAGVPEADLREMIALVLQRLAH